MSEESSALEELSRLITQSDAVRRLRGLRRHLFAVFSLFVVASIAGFVVSPSVLTDMQQRQMGIGQLVMLSPTEGFMVRIKLGLVVGAAATLPAIMLVVWSVVTRSWAFWRRFRSFLLVPVALGLFAGGGYFAYDVLIPVALRFLLSFAAGPLQPFVSVDSFVQFVITVVLAAGLVFQIPLFVFFLTRLGVINHRTLAARRPYALVGSAALAAVLTPADVFSMLLLAIPLALLYELSIWVAWLAAPRPLRPARTLKPAAREP